MKSVIYTFLFLFFIQSYSEAQIADTVLARQYLDSIKYYPDGAEICFQNGAIVYDLRKKALAIYKQALGEDHLLTAEAYYELGWHLTDTHGSDSAVVYVRKALDIRLKKLGPEHPDISACYWKLVHMHKDYGKKWEYINKSLDIDLKVFGEDHPRVARDYNSLANLYLAEGDYPKAIEYYTKAYNICFAYYSGNHFNVARYDHHIGDVYLLTGEFDKALKYFQRALPNYKRVLQCDHLQYERLYESMGVVYFEIGEYEKAIEYFEKGLAVLHNLGYKYGPDLANLYINFGKAYISLHNYNKALNFSLNALEMFNTSTGRIEDFIVLAHLCLANIYSEIGEYRTALKHADLAIDQRIKVSGIENHPEIIKALALKGITHKKAGNKVKALHFFEKVIDNWHNEFHPEIAIAFINIASIYREKGDDEQVSVYFGEALKVWQKVFGENHPEVARTYHKLANLKIEKKEYQEALALLNKAINSLVLFNRNASNQASKKFHLAKSYSIFEDAIQTICKAKLQSPEQVDLNFAFTYAERSKANLLQEALNKNHAEEFVGVPENLLEEEHQLKIEIAHLERKKYVEFEKGTSKNDSLINEFNSQIFDLKEQLTTFAGQLEKDYPEYYELKYKSEVASVEQVQSELLEADQALLEYFVGDSSIFVFIITQNDYQVHDFKRDFPLRDWVTQMRSGLYNYHLSGKDDEASYKAYADTFAMASHQLYEKLLAPFEKDLPEKLIIVPDGVLSYIPFEVLLKQNPKENHQFKNHAYFIKDHQISYGYSATFLMELKRKKTKASKGLLAFAPSFESDDQLLASVDARRSGLGPLQFSVPEVEGIQALLGGEIYLGESATEENFTQLAENYNILHLATHGKANDKASDYSYLAFTEIEDSLENEFLYVRDLYNMKLNADMVVLSACETGLGELQRGEGVVSLARGFSYAGAKSIITTLWSVSDENTKDLMLPFYQNIKSGMDKDAALRKAKLDYIEQNSHLEAHPFYWAGLIPLGNMEPVSSGASFGGWMGYGLIALGAVLILFWLFRRNQTA